MLFKRTARPAYDQRGANQAMGELVPFGMVQDLHQDVDRCLCQQLFALIDRGQHNLGKRGVDDIVESKQRYILGYGDAKFIGRLQNAERKRIGCRKDRSAVKAPLKQRFSQRIAVGDRRRIRGVFDDLGHDAERVERLTEAAKAHLMRDAGRAETEIQDLSVAEGIQILGGEPSALQIVYADRVDAAALAVVDRVAEQNDGNGTGILVYPVFLLRCTNWQG